MAGIPINSGTGPEVATDLVGTDNYQIVKVIQGAAGATVGMGNAFVVTGSVSVGVSTLTATTGTFSITGPVFVTNTGVFNVATITTLLGTVSVSGGGGGVQYPINDTSMLATGTGTLILGLQTGATTSRGIAVTTTGAQFVVFPAAQIVTAANVTIASVTTGTMNVINVLSASGVTIASVATGTMNVINVLSASGVTIGNITGSSVYTVAGTALGTTGQGFLILGIQTGSTAAQPIAVSTTGYSYIANVVTGTMNVVNTVAISGSASVINTVAISGSASVINTVTITGSASMSGTGNVTVVGKPLVLSQPTTANNLNGNVVVTNSSNAICLTSGAYTICITDLVVSVDVPMNVTFFSAATTKAGPFYFATKGGMALGLTSPIILNSNQSFTVTPSLTGSCTVFAAGFSTV